jgi:hypothetical protein
MDAPELPFEYCALRFLIQWEQRERTLYVQIAGNPSLAEIRSALRYFQVARMFKALKSDHAAQAVADALRDVDEESTLSPVQKVVALASCFKKRFNQLNLSTASKLLWLKHKEPYVVHDSRAVSALKEMGARFTNANYEKYWSCWREQYCRRQSEVRKAASRLHEIRRFLPHWHRKENELTALALQEWFLERVFDIYLWELGGEG